MTCRYCEGVRVRRSVLESGTEMIRDAPKCAFVADVFDATNWDCGTMNRLRDMVENPVWGDDQWAGIVRHGGCFVVLGWYKSRGRTEFATVVEEFESCPLQLATAYAIIDEATP